MPYAFKCMQYLTMRDFIDTTGKVVCVFLLVSVLICKYVSFNTCVFIYQCLLPYVCCDDILFTWQVRNDFNKDVYIEIEMLIEEQMYKQIQQIHNRVLLHNLCANSLISWIALLFVLSMSMKIFELLHLWAVTWSRVFQFSSGSEITTISSPKLNIDIFTSLTNTPSWCCLIFVIDHF